MTHNDFEDRLNAVLDEREQLDADERLRARSREDSRSRELLDSYWAMLAGIDSVETPPAPWDMSQRVISELTQPAVIRFSLHRRVAAVVAVAAALLATVAWWQFESPDHIGIASRNAADNVEVGESLSDQQEGASKSASAVAAETTRNSESLAEAPEEDPPLGTMVRESGEAYAQLVRDTQESMADLALLFPDVGLAKRKSSPPKEGPIDVDPSAESSDSPRATGWMNQMTDGLRPLTNATSGAFNILLRSLPSETNDSDS